MQRRRQSQEEEKNSEKCQRGVRKMKKELGQ
jgi:hypothetical protein